MPSVISISSLYAAAIAFIGIHIAVSGTGLRGVLVNRMGERVYQGCFALASLGILIWLCVSYSMVAETATFWWQPPSWVGFSAPFFGGLALFFGVLGLLTPSPTSVGGEKALETENPARGILTITRHPFLCGVVIWAAFHIIAAPTIAAFALFGTFLVVGVAGARSIDAKRQKALGETYALFMEKTSITPFLAIIRGRQKFDMKGVAWWQWASLLLVFAAILALHPVLFGVSAVPFSRF